jgi:hypothetical protein
VQMRTVLPGELGVVHVAGDEDEEAAARAQVGERDTPRGTV